MSKLKRRSVLRDKNPIYDIKLTKKEHEAILSTSYEGAAICLIFPELTNKRWWRTGRTLSWQKGMK